MAWADLRDADVLWGWEMTGNDDVAWPTTHTTFVLGNLVEKKRGSSWHGRVVGWYSTQLTPEGYAVESTYEPGSVQIYPAAALRRNDETRIIKNSSGLWTLHVTHSCGHTMGYMFGLKEAAEREKPKYEAQDCPICENKKWLAAEEGR